MKKFHEYLNSKNKVVSKPKIKVVADEVDVPASKKKAPPKGVGMTGGKQPYVKDNGGKPTMAKGKGFGDLKSPNVPYYDATKEPKAAKIPTAEITSTHQLGPLVRESIKADPRTVEVIVRDLKRHDMLGALVGELLTHKETYDQIACVMNSNKYGKDVCNKLSKAIRESGTSVPLADEMEGGEDGEDQDGVDPDGLPGDESSLEDPDAMSDEESDGMEDDEMDPDAMGDEDMDGMDPDAMDGEPQPMIGPDGQPVIGPDGQPVMMPPGGGDEDPNMPLSPYGHSGPDAPPPALEHLMRVLNRKRR